MSFRVKDRQIVREKGYHYTQAETGVTLTASQLGRLHNTVRKHRIANNLPIGVDLMGEIEDQICQHNPHLCEASTEEDKVSLFNMAMNFTTSVTRWMASGLPVVSEADYEQRKATCLKCEHFKGWKEAGIGICRKCGCPNGRLSLKLWMATEKCPLKEPKW